MESIFAWGLIATIAGAVLTVIAFFVVAYRRRREHDAHLAQHGIAGVARVVGVERHNIRVNNRRGWTLTLVWRDPVAGTEHQITSDLIWERDVLGYSPRDRLLAVGELPVRVDPRAPERYHSVDTSSLLREDH